MIYLAAEAGSLLICRGGGGGAPVGTLSLIDYGPSAEEKIPLVLKVSYLAMYDSKQLRRI